MPYALLAELVVLLHFAQVLFAIFGGLLAFRWPRIVFLHLPVLAWAAWIEFSHRPWCPLTPLEKWLRQAAGQSFYEGGFLNHYIIRILYPPGLTPTHQLLLGIALLALNLTIYTLVWRRRRKARRQPGRS